MGLRAPEGLPVELSVEGEPRALPPVDLSACTEAGIGAANTRRSRNERRSDPLSPSPAAASAATRPVIAISRSAHRILARHRLDAILGGIDYALAHDYPAREKA
jgi:hypothetical protein